MNLSLEPITLETRHKFKISRGEKKRARNFIFHLSWEGLTGIGEAAPQAYYSEDEQTVLDAVNKVSGKLDDEPEALIDRLFSGDLRKLLGKDASVRAALDMALWDLIGKRDGKPCYELFSLNPQKTPLTSFTIGFDRPKVIETKIKEADPYKILKVKMGLPGDMDVLDLVIRLSGKKVRVDANEGWDLQTALYLLAELKKRNVELVEQPISHHKREDLRRLKKSSEIPIILDESIISPEDIENCKEQGHGINIKLMKCGGITPALDMIKRARKLGLKVMLGCMIESSLGITAAAHLSPEADFADLDGNLLLSEDPFMGVKVEGGRLILPKGAGLGVERRN